ncbi:hypothetical protein YT1_p20048 (plasmid) [Rhodococcus ruber]|nr:hypothetical protein YT1_p20048 [Rhodococcus ruber]
MAQCQPPTAEPEKRTATDVNELPLYARTIYLGFDGPPNPSTTSQEVSRVCGGY